MFKIDTPNAVLVEPVASAPGIAGYFDDSGLNATELSADWCNAVQGELVAAIEGLGGTLTKGDNDQLWTLLEPRIVSDTGVLDTPAATTLALGPATATKVEIADTGITTEVQGPLDAVEGITTNTLDARSATTLAIGASTATKVEIADTGVTTEVQGDLHVLGNVVDINLDTATVADTGTNNKVSGKLTKTETTIAAGTPATLYHLNSKVSPSSIILWSFTASTERYKLAQGVAIPGSGSVTFDIINVTAGVWPSVGTGDLTISYVVINPA